MRRRSSHVGAVLHRGEPSNGIVGKARRDGRVGAVAQQPQRDVHPDLRPPAGEQRTATAEVRAGVAARVVARGAGRTELVVERVDRRDSAACRCNTRGHGAACPRTCPAAREHEREPLGLVVDPPGRPGRRRGGDRLVVRADRGAPLGPPLLLHRLEQPARGTPDRDGVGMLVGETLHLGEDAQGIGEAIGVDAVHRRERRSKPGERAQSRCCSSQSSAMRRFASDSSSATPWPTSSDTAIREPIAPRVRGFTDACSRWSLMNSTLRGW